MIHFFMYFHKESFHILTFPPAMFVVTWWFLTSPAYWTMVIIYMVYSIIYDQLEKMAALDAELLTFSTFALPRFYLVITYPYTYSKRHTALW